MANGVDAMAKIAVIIFITVMILLVVLFVMTEIAVMAVCVMTCICHVYNAYSRCNTFTSTLLIALSTSCAPPKPSRLLTKTLIQNNFVHQT